MAAPSATARGTPGGIRLDDGFTTKITMSADATIEFWEKTVQPPSVDGGDAIETTTMHNTIWRTFAPGPLLSLGEVSVTAAYDPDVYAAIVAQLNDEQTITVTFADGTTIAFFGFMRTFEPQEVTSGEQPEANIVFQPTNYDRTNHVEAAPVLTAVSGT